MLSKRLLEQLALRQEQGNLRVLSLPNNNIDFFSNDYLGLAQNKELTEQIEQNYKRFQIQKNGATGSRLLSGNSEPVMRLEASLADYFKGQAALLFNSGYDANLALLAALPQRNDTVLYDELIHASLRDATRLNFANNYPFRHNDWNDLEAKIKRAKGEIFVVTESVFSMDGDMPDLNSLVQLQERYQLNLLIDEAHGGGIFGTNGNGLVCELGLEKHFLARLYTFGKAFGVHGAVVVGSQTLIDYLINFARPFIYTTALPLHSICAIDAAVEYVKNNYQALIEPLKNNLGHQKTPIQVVQIAGNANCKAASQKLMRLGYDVKAILSPTVAQGQERLRICLHNFNTPTEIKGLYAAIGL